MKVEITCVVVAEVTFAHSVRHLGCIAQRSHQSEGTLR